jgi:hypothetical protein
VKTNGKMALSRRKEKVARSSESDTAKLAQRIAAYARHDGVFDLSIPGLHASRYSRIHADCVHALENTSMRVVSYS